MGTCMKAEEVFSRVVSGQSLDIKCNAPQYVEIVEAPYGKNCNPENRNTHLTPLQTACQHHSNRCTYTADFILIEVGIHVTGCSSGVSPQYDYRYMCVHLDPSSAPLVPINEPYNPYNPDGNVFVMSETTAYLFAGLLAVMLLVNILLVQIKHKNIMQLNITHKLRGCCINHIVYTIQYFLVII